MQRNRRIKGRAPRLHPTCIAQTEGHRGVIRDPFYRQIIEALGRRLDGDRFEHCVTDLLRAYEPGLAPIRGGADEGMDSAIPDHEGPAYPLAVTTQHDVIGNLTRNLKQYIHKGGVRRKVQLATSQTLSVKQRECCLPSGRTSAVPSPTRSASPLWNDWASLAPSPSTGTSVSTVSSSSLHRVLLSSCCSAARLLVPLVNQPSRL